MNENTKMFSLEEEKSQEIHQMFQTVFSALEQKGYCPIGQIVGYLLSEDPTYITTHQGARKLMQAYDRDDLLNELVRYYLNKHT